MSPFFLLPNCVRPFALKLLVLTAALTLTPFVIAQTETTINNFNGTNGQGPWAGMIFDQAGNLYGTTSGGGTYGYGTVFELTPTAGGWQETVLYSFANGADGKWPYAGVVFDAAGNLYGATFGGGIANNACPQNGCGTVFQLSPSSGGTWTKTLLYTFTGSVDGANPVGTPVLDSSGNVYGTTLYGGHHPLNSIGGGVVFELSPSSTGWTEKILHTFSGGLDGRTPYSGVVFDSSGNLYGTTSFGGNLSDCSGFGCGVVYRLSRNAKGTWTDSIVHTFTGHGDGANPWGPVTLDASRNIYGTTQYAGASGYYGVVFRVSPTSKGGWTILHSFDSTDGQWPQGGLLIDSTGNVFGTTIEGGAIGAGGVVFELSPQSGGGWTEKALVDFSQAILGGAYPSCNLTSDRAGNLFGTTQANGGNGDGTVFEITP